MKCAIDDIENCSLVLTSDKHKKTFCITSSLTISTQAHYIHIGVTWRIRLNDPCPVAMHGLISSDYFDHLLLLLLFSTVVIGL